MDNIQELKQLDLARWIEARGYERDKRKSSRASVFLRAKGSGDSVFVRQADNGNFVYCNVHDSADNGSIIDFVMHRDGCSYVEAVKRLLKENPTHFSFPTGSSNSTQSVAVRDSEPDRPKISAGWNRGVWVAEHPYLLQRNIPASTLNDPRFNDGWRQTRKGHCLFPHRDMSGLCGLEIRGENLKMFSRGGKKGLWVSANIKTAIRIVITESPIDALSFHALHVDASDALWPLGYASFGGGMGNRQKSLLQTLMTRSANRGAEIVIAVDNDPAGDEYADALATLAPVALERILPIDKDFNADLAWCVLETGQ